MANIHSYEENPIQGIHIFRNILLQTVIYDIFTCFFKGEGVKKSVTVVTKPITVSSASTLTSLISAQPVQQAAG